MLDDIASASSSIHINQFGFRPGVVGDEVAEALKAYALAMGALAVAAAIGLGAAIFLPARVEPAKA